MNFLIVDQLGKTTGRETLALAELINKDTDIKVYVYLSDTTEIPKDKTYTVNIKKGFEGAYEGSFFNKGINYLRALKKLKQYIIEKNINVVYLQWFSLPWIEWIYVYLLKKYCKVVVMIHDVIPFNNRPWEMKALNKIYNNVDALFIHTDIAKKEFYDNYKTKTSLFVTGQAFSNRDDCEKVNKNVAREYLNIPKDKIVYLFFGTIRESKGLDILIKAFNKAFIENKDIFLLIAGAFNKVDEKKYKLLVDNLLNINNSLVDFKFIPYEEEKYYFSSADILCLPYRELTQSGVAQLGLIYGLPIIGTDVGAMKEVVINEENGLIFEVNNIDDCKNCILKLAINKDFRKRCSINSDKLSKSRFLLENKSNKIIKVIKSIYAL